jgi:hypothetical protein
MNFPCASPPSLCLQDAEPVIAYSAEVLDSPTFIGIAWGSTLPPLGKYFDVFVAEGICESQISQDAANQCAQRLVVEQITPCLPVFQSAGVIATLLCPDGSPYSYIVPADTFEALTQAQADQMAQAFATSKLAGHSVCLSGLPPSFASLNSPYSGSVSATGPDSPFTFAVVSGSPPPGVGLSSSGALSGIPTATGVFLFTIQATSATGVYTQKTYSITVFAITTTSPLPDGFTGVAYSQMLTSSDLSDSAAWSVAAGTLPNGLSLGSTGVITGSCTIAGTFNFTIGLTIGGVVALKNFSILVHPINWNNLVWQNIFNVPGTGFAFSVFNGASFAVNAQGSGGAGQAFVRAIGTIPFVGATTHCQIAVSVTSCTTTNMGFLIQQDGVTVLTVGTLNLTPIGNYVFPFTLNASLGSTITIIGLVNLALSSRLFVQSEDNNFGTYSAVVSNV